MGTIDLTYLNSVTDGDSTLVKELIDIFKAQVPEYIEEFNAAMQTQNADVIGKIAHKAKSSVAIMGMTQLAEELKELENKGREGNFDAKIYQNFIDSFEKQCALAIEELEAL
ncbi:MAG: Hpt domain-containing protein [Bacteroidales bacterium]|nr:Hpt domain-containing protein [Bacteroidales bacterium]